VKRELRSAICTVRGLGYNRECRTTSAVQVIYKVGLVWRAD
jgi:hypothetical protein